MSDIVKVLRDLCDNNYNDNFEKVLNDLLDYYDHDNTAVVKALDSINESISLEGLDAMETTIEEIQNLRAEVKQLKGDLSVANLRIEAKEKYNAKKNELTDRLIEWAQNNEMVDNKYTDHGKDCLEAAKLIKAFQKANHLYEWSGLEK